MSEVAKGCYFQRKAGVGKAVRYITANPTVYTHAIHRFNALKVLPSQPYTLAQKSKTASDLIY